MQDLTVLQAKRYGTFSCHSRTTLLGAARRMANEDISALVVTDDDGYLAGYLFDQDNTYVRRHCPIVAAKGQWRLTSTRSCCATRRQFGHIGWSAASRS